MHVDKAHGTYWKGSSMGFRAGLDAIEERKLPFPEIEPRLFDRLATA
jgi:hypothetical protein